MEEGGNHQIIQFSGLANALGQAENRRMQTTMNRRGGVFVLATFILGLAKPLAETEAPAKPEADDFQFESNPRLVDGEARLLKDLLENQDRLLRSGDCFLVVLPPAPRSEVVDLGEVRTRVVRSQEG